MRIFECLLIGVFVQLRPIVPINEIPLICSIYWLTFEIGTNVISLDTFAFYVGKSGGLDSLGNKKWLLILITILISILWMVYT